MSKFTFVAHVTAHAKAEKKTAGLMAKACDSFKADGITIAMFAAADKSDKAEEFRDTLKRAIVAAFSAADRKLLDTPTKGLSDAGRKQKRNAQMQIGARVNDYKRAYQRRLEGPAKKGADQRTDDKTFVEERLVAIIKRLQKSEDAGFDTVTVIAGAQAMLKAIQAKI